MLSFVKNINELSRRTTNLKNVSESKGLTLLFLAQLGSPACVSAGSAPVVL
jgi:hypothetical protein